MRSPQEIQLELDDATERRSELWARLSAGVDGVTSDELEGLRRTIEALWGELRAAKAFIRSGPPDRIIARARAEDRFDREERRSRRVAA